MSKELKTFQKPLTSADLEGKIDQLTSEYPYIKKKVIGQSVLGKDIMELRIGTGRRHVHYNASFHANEWITTIVLMQFFSEYARLYSVGDANPDISLSVIPMVNPDGVDLVLEGSSAACAYEETVIGINDGRSDFSEWKANIKGVDLNKQFPAGWEIEASRKPKNPHFRDYPGREPLTEPESVAIAQFMKQNFFDEMHAVHTQGEEIYWGFNGFEPPESSEIVRNYAELSGYEAVKNLDNYAGLKDWYLQEFNRPAFTLELGKGKNPLPLSQLDDIYSKVSRIFWASVNM